MWIGSIYARNITSLTPAPTCSKLQNLTRCVPQGLTYVQYASALRALRVRTCFLWEMRNLTRGVCCVWGGMKWGKRAMKLHGVG